MTERKRTQIRQPMADNASLFVGATMCTIASVFLGFMTPAVLAEVLTITWGQAPPACLRRSAAGRMRWAAGATCCCPHCSRRAAGIDQPDKRPVQLLQGAMDSYGL